MTEKAVSIQDMSRIHLIFGDFDNNINIIQKEYKVSIFTRDDEIRIKGDENAVDNAEQVIKTLISTVEKGETPTEQSVRYAISMTNEGKGEEVQTLTADCVCVSHTGKPIKATSQEKATHHRPPAPDCRPAGSKIAAIRPDPFRSRGKR